MKVEVKVGDDNFVVEGEFSFDEGFVQFFREWTRALGPTPGQAEIDAITEQLKGQQTDLQSVVTQHTPQQGAHPDGT